MGKLSAPGMEKTSKNLRSVVSTRKKKHSNKPGAL